MSPISAVLLLALASPQPPAPTPTPFQTPVVAALLEDLRKAELLLDVEGLELQVAHSLVVVEGGARVAGSFGYLEPLRRIRAREGEVRKLVFLDRMVQVYGASAVATYRIDKVWTDQGSRKRQQGWCTDVFELRDDGAWILVHRQRP